MTRTWLKALMGATALTAFAAAPAMAQTDPASEAPPTAEEAAAQAEFLSAQIEAMQAQIEELKKQVKTSTPNWKGAPEFAGSDFKFKVRGRFMYDAAYVENPNNLVASKEFGASTRVRRIRLGVEGGLPGGFAYKAEFDFANSAVGYADVTLSYKNPKSQFGVTIGNFESLNGFEQISSSRYISFIERAQFNEAFNNTRRLGVAVNYTSKDGQFKFDVGAFNDTINANTDNDDLILAGRAVYAPQAMGGQLHFGANFQHRKFQTNVLSNQYRARPFTQNAGFRFVDTGNVAARGDDIYGLEFIGIFGPLHLSAEGQYTKVDAIRVPDVLPGRDATTGVRTNGDPSFFGFYAEAGYWLTGETRGYKNGVLDRTKVLNPFDKGGWGAFQINARYDYLDLTDSTGATLPTQVTAPNFVNGGTQTGYLASLIWQPIDYVRFTAQYTYGVVKGGPRAATVVPVSTETVVNRDYNFSAAMLRAAFDF